MARVLIIDDDAVLSDMLAEIVFDMGHVALKAATLNNGLQAASRDDFDVILLDVNLPDGNGLTKLSALKQKCSPAEIIIITAYSDQNGAELALNNGVWDYIQKTSSISEIQLSLSRAIQYVEANNERPPDLPEVDLKGIIGRSDQMKICYGRLAQAARSEANVLITGETGTGKELFARAIHKNSRRAHGPFITVDCAALTPTLIESQLFGHEKGAFTGAEKKMDGMITQADGGVLFLDEVGELPVPVQKSFLRVLQEKHFRPIGSRHEIESNFRLVAATNRNLDEMVAAGTFRSDLLYRIRSMVLKLPPLRAHLSDIPELLFSYVPKLCSRYSLAIKSISPEFFELMSTYTWPGNIRELINTLEYAIAAAFD